ncbi:MAG: GGDEF domain-containing protein [Solobacterium sp.]|nr:GGDEF domain-containing protein [Solobacterium sp.]
MMQQNEIAYIDPLVGTYNRQYLNNILSAWSARGYSFAGVMLDIDRFKQINDTYGHTEGDRALKTATDLLKASRTGNELVFRFAGDEFIVLRLTNDKEGLQEYLANLKQNTDAYNQSAPLCPLSFSYGTGFFQNGEIDSFMKEMDSRMYEMKAEHHKEQVPAA